MSSHPPGLRFSLVATSSIPNTNKINNNINTIDNSCANHFINSNYNNNNINNTTGKNMQHQLPQPQTQISRKSSNVSVAGTTMKQQHQHHLQLPQLQSLPQYSNNNNNNTTNIGGNTTIATGSSLSGSETDISTSNENLSFEQRYVLRHTPRVEPQGQENLTENNLTSGNENQIRYSVDQRCFPSNTSSGDSTQRYGSSNRSISETRNPIYMQSMNGSSSGGGGGGNVVVGLSNNNSPSNRNSLKESNSNRSSMDVSSCSYNTLIIHNDDNSIYSIGTHRDFGSPSDIMKKSDRPRSYGEQGMQEITEIPDDYLNQSHVLKHLAKEIKIPIAIRRSSQRDSGILENVELKDTLGPPKYTGQWSIIEEQCEQNVGNDNENGGNGCNGNGSSKIKSKSQPDLTKLTEADMDTMETLIKENQLLKQQLYSCYMKVAKTQKLEEEVANIYRVHEELKQTCERREKLERAARMRLQSDLNRVQELNCVMKDQVDILQSQLLAPSEHQILIAQFFTQNKELSAAKERQEIELVAQRATLQEQRNHIGILDTALTNAQHNIRRLEDELRKKQVYIDRLTQLHGAVLQQTTTTTMTAMSTGNNKQNDRNKTPRLDYETELCKDSNRSGSSTHSESKWQQLQEKSNQILRLESEQRHLDERQATPKSLQNLDKTNQEDRIITEAKQDKLRYLEEVHTAQRTVNDLQAHLKFLESKLAEKDAVIRVLQEKKICGSSFDSYNSFGLNPLGYNSQASFNVSNTSFNTTTNTSLLDHQMGGYVGIGSCSGNNGGIGGIGGGGSNSSNNGVGVSGSIGSVTNNYIATSSNSLGNMSYVVPNQLPYNQSKPISTYNQSAINLQAITGTGIYSPHNTTSNYTNTTMVNNNNSVGGVGGGTGGGVGGGNNFDGTIINYQSQSTTGQHNASGYDSSSSATSTPIASPYDNLARKSIDDHLMKKQLDEQLLSKRGLCCFPSLTTKKPNQPLLSDQVSVLSTNNNSDVFFQKFAQFDQRERQQQQQQQQDQQHELTSIQSSSMSNNNNKSDNDIVLLEKQGICSQKTRNNTTGNLAQVTQTVGQNMTDISNIGSSGSIGTTKKIPKIVTNLTQNLSNITQTGILPPRLKERSGSLPPSALPRPPRSLKPPRKIEYDRISDVDTNLKTRSQTPPKHQSPSSAITVTPTYELKTSSLKRNEFIRREFSPHKNYIEMKDSMQFPKTDFSLKRKDYGTINNSNNNTNINNKSGDFSKPDFTSTKNYQRLEESPKPSNKMPSDGGNSTLKRSLLSNVRKYSPSAASANKNSRDSLNSSESNNSSNSNQRSTSPVHLKSDSNSSNITAHNSRTPPKYASMVGHHHHHHQQQQQQQQQHPQQQQHQHQNHQINHHRSQPMKGSMIPNKMATYSTTTNNNICSSPASLPPKPSADNKISSTRRGNSLTRGENRYRIQF